MAVYRDMEIGGEGVGATGSACGLEAHVYTGCIDSNTKQVYDTAEFT